MASYIDWYLVELERRLRGKMPSERAHIVLSETSEHLREESAELVSSGMAIEASERSAIRSFGSPGRVAFELLEGPVPTWRSVAGLICLVVVGKPS